MKSPREMTSEREREPHARALSRNGGRAAAVGHLRGLLEIARLVRREPALDEVLAAVARTVAEALGFATVVVNLYRPETDDYEVTTVHGNQAARDVLLGQVTPSASWTRLLDPQFLRRGAFFVPEGTLEWDEEMASYVPELPAGASEGKEAWHADDALFVALDGSGARRYGIISVDEPRSGLRPDDQQLDVLSAVAAHAALAIESAHQVRALEAAVARHRAMIESSLDCVIAMDKQGRVLEFNPAAEQTFGFRSEDAVGRDLAELIIPPEYRDAHRRALARVAAHGESRLLGRRIETTAVRADGGILPIEVALTCVQSSDSEAPVFYGFLRDISERRRVEEQLTYLAYHDPLTGLPNRALVEQELDLALARARRAGNAVAVMFVDLDDFKLANDRLGHAAGDRLLAAAGERLGSVLRESDLLARQGGDEFLVVLSDLSGDPALAAEAVTGNLLDALREPFVLSGTELRIGASVGISLYPDDAADTEGLLRHADSAMYRAKANGGGRLVFHERSAALPLRRISLSVQLRRAIAHGELELHYQPVCRLAGGVIEVAGVEALVRWRHPERGLLLPGTFIKVAEQSALGDDLADWVLQEACRQALQWREDGLNPTIAINVSPHQLRAPAFAARFVHQIRNLGLSSGQFVVDVIESAWTVDAAVTLPVIAELRAAGVHLAIDDFGAGYSSLARLRELEFDFLKVDRGLLRDVPADATAVAILRAILDLARACGSLVVLEGVETEEQRGFLFEYGVDLAQGYYLGRPMQASDVTRLLELQPLDGTRAPV